jgi:hypothetical protein
LRRERHHRAGRADSLLAGAPQTLPGLRSAAEAAKWRDDASPTRTVCAPVRWDFERDLSRDEHTNPPRDQGDTADRSAWDSGCPACGAFHCGCEWTSRTGVLRPRRAPQGRVPHRRSGLMERRFGAEVPTTALGVRIGRTTRPAHWAMRTPRDSAADHRVLPGDRRHRRDDLVREPSAVVGALGGRRDANDDLVAVDLLEQHARL